VPQANGKQYCCRAAGHETTGQLAAGLRVRNTDTFRFSAESIGRLWVRRRQSDLPWTPLSFTDNPGTRTASRNRCGVKKGANPKR
jgi:hypothetical protein